MFDIATLDGTVLSDPQLQRRLAAASRLTRQMSQRFFFYLQKTFEFIRAHITIRGMVHYNKAHSKGLEFSSIHLKAAQANARPSRSL